MGDRAISWQGAQGDTTEGTTIPAGIREVAGSAVTVLSSADGTLPPEEQNVQLVILVVGETPYAEGWGDRTDLSLSDSDEKSLANAEKIGAPIVLVLVSGRPLVVSEELEKVNALIAAWLPGTEGGGIADVLFGKAPFRGKLPITWPRDGSSIGDRNAANVLFQYGDGLAY